MTACWHPAPWDDCPSCDGPSREQELADEWGPIGEACIGIDWDGQPCPRRAEDGSLWCDQHTWQNGLAVPLAVAA